MGESESRLSKRAWLLDNFDYVFKQAVYYRNMKEDFANERVHLWSWGDEEGRAKIVYVD